jgi:hypothetical protein
MANAATKINEERASSQIERGAMSDGDLASSPIVGRVAEAANV